MLGQCTLFSSCMEAAPSLSSTHLCMSLKAEGSTSCVFSFPLTHSGFPSTLVVSTTTSVRMTLTPVFAFLPQILFHIQASVTHCHICSCTAGWRQNVTSDPWEGESPPSQFPSLHPWHLLHLVQSQNFLWFLLLLPAPYTKSSIKSSKIYLVYVSFFSIYHHPLVYIVIIQKPLTPLSNTHFQLSHPASTLQLTELSQVPLSLHSSPEETRFLTVVHLHAPQILAVVSMRSPRSIFLEY